MKQGNAMSLPKEGLVQCCNCATHRCTITAYRRNTTGIEQ